MISSYSRGHKIEYQNDRWVWTDNGELVDWKAQRPCARCGRLPTPEGYDACLGYIPGAVAACCGHGGMRGFINFPNQLIMLDPILGNNKDVVPKSDHS